jgi:site-specific recombinase XerD
VKVVRKGGAEQHVYFNENTASALSDYINGERLRYIPESGEKALFLSSQRKRMTVRAVEYMVKKYAKIAAPDKKISPHKARSSFATELYQQTSDIRLVADVLGHEDVSVTARRYSAAKSQNRQKAGKIDIWG